MIRKPLLWYGSSALQFQTSLSLLCHFSVTSFNFLVNLIFTSLSLPLKAFNVIYEFLQDF